MISSLTNEKIKRVVKLQQKKYRDLENKFIVETFNMIEEAKKKNCLLEVFTTLENISFDDVIVNVVSKDVMKKISSLENSSILGVCSKNEDKGIYGKKILLLDGIQDPGNLGTILRTALGFYIDTVILSNDTCDLYNPKVVRATEGAIFKLNVVRMDLSVAIKNLKAKNIIIYGTDVEGGTLVKKVKVKDSFALIMGNEGRGVKDEIKDMVNKNLYIPTNKELESLNVGVATGILLYELTK